MVTEENIHESVRVWVEDLLPLLRKGAETSVYARKEAKEMHCLTMAAQVSCTVNTERIAAIQHAVSADVWGQSNERVLAGVRNYALDRHLMIARSFGVKVDGFLSFALCSRVLEHSGDVKVSYFGNSVPPS